ncbi:MAG: hypothetical protein AAGI90_02855 [Chlamydiota bacterium]
MVDHISNTPPKTPMNDGIPQKNPESNGVKKLAAKVEQVVSDNKPIHSIGGIGCNPNNYKLTNRQVMVDSSKTPIPFKPYTQNGG